MPSPIVEATLQAAGLSTASNICAQYIDAYRHEVRARTGPFRVRARPGHCPTNPRAQRPFAFDQYQLVRFLLLTLLTTPPNFVWQQFLEKRFPAYVASVYKRSDEVTELEKAEEGGRTTPRPDAAQQPPLQSAFSLRNTLTKWFIDCITVGALLNTVAFLVIMGVLKHQSASKIWLNVQEVSATRARVTLLRAPLGQP